VNYFQRYLVDEFAEEYQEGRISRREALRLIASVTGSLAAATSILAACAPLSTPTGENQAAQSTTAGAAPENTATPTTAPTATAPQETRPATAASPTAPAASSTPPSAGTPLAAGSTPPAAGTVAPDDPAVQAGALEFSGQDGAALLGYLARPQGDGPFAVVLVCHENRGLTPHIEDVTRRLAKAGYVGLAVDLLSRQGGSAAVGQANVPGVLGQTPSEQYVQDFLSGWAFLKTQPYAQAERVGMVGFCYGGGVTWTMATRMPELRAAVPFYGPHPPLEDVEDIQAAVLAIYGGKDARINQGIPAIEEAMKANNKVFEKVIYPDADHAFHNDTGSRYHPESARDAWSRTLAWFAAYL
jgi:carboxymethylenebutenolidase